MFDLGRYEQAMTECRRALAIEPDHPLALYLLALAALNLEPEDLVTAGEAGRRLASVYPDGPAGSEVLGLVAARKDEPFAAEKHLRHALRLAPDSGHHHALLAWHLRSRDRLEEAITVARGGLALDPQSASQLRLLATLYRLNDEPELAERYGSQALAADPESADAHLECAFRLLERGQPTAARGNFLASLRLRPAAGATLEAIAHERARNNPFFRRGVFLSTRADLIAAAAFVPVFWSLLSLVWSPLRFLAYASAGVIGAGYLYVGMFRLWRRRILRRLQTGKL